MSRPSIIINLVLGLLWTITHLAISFLNLWSHLIYSLECYLISSGLLRKYQNLHLGRLKCLAIVVDSKEAKSTAKVKQLLCWFSSMGVKYVCLYDIEGKTMSSTFELQGMAVYSLKFVVDYLSTYMIIPFL
jgi:ditrans,polycis-polyprenyl diphosphate synthase